MRNFKLKKSISIPLIIILIMIVLNIIARLSKVFSDFYVRNVFPYLSNVFSFISGVFSFSVGEVMIKLAILIVVISIPLGIVLFIRKKNLRLKIVQSYISGYLWILAYILSTETLNCFIMYQCTPFSQVYFSESERSRKQIVQLYEILVNNTNELAEQVQRDENGHFTLTCDVKKEAKIAMKNISEEYPQLKGYYPDPKPVNSAYIMSQMSILGIYFPFSLEANYNPEVYDCNIPNTLCHEFTHLKGIIHEDEAGFFAFLASTQSDNIEFQYSGYLNALEYVNNEIYKNNITEAYEISDRISQYTAQDLYTFVPEEYWEESEEKLIPDMMSDVISTETINEISDKVTDTSLKINGVEDGIQSYSRIVNLLLDYYFAE